MNTPPERLMIPPNGGVPNNPSLPGLVMRAAIDPVEARVREMFHVNGWGGLWTWTVFDYHHWHPDSHEALACICGWADLHLGGPDGPVVRVEAGDVAVLPAGFGHKRAASGGGFAVVGAYPPGQESPEICRADEMDISTALNRITATPLPRTDPLGLGHVRTAWGTES